MSYTSAGVSPALTSHQISLPASSLIAPSHSANLVRRYFAADAMEFSPSNDTISCHIAPSLVFTVCCNPPGHGGANANNCGNQTFREPLMLDPLDTWGEEHGNQYFTFDAQSRHIALNKSGRCVSASGASVGSPIALDSCANRLSSWQQNANGSFELLLSGSGGTHHPSGLCVGVAGGGGNQQDIFTIDRPFTYPLDATSHITILPYTGARC